MLAQAADSVPVRIPTKAPAMVRPVGTWTGFYIGGNVGYGWGDYSASNATGTIVNTNGGSIFDYLLLPTARNDSNLIRFREKGSVDHGIECYKSEHELALAVANRATNGIHASRTRSKIPEQSSDPNRIQEKDRCRAASIDRR